MKFSTALLALVASTAVAQPIVKRHAHHQHKRDANVEYVYVTNYVDHNGNPVDANGNPLQPVAAATQAPAPVVEVAAAATPAAAPAAFAAAPAAAPAQEEKKAEAAAPAPAQEEKKTEAPSSQGVPKTDSGAFPGGALGMVYSPYNADGTCKDAGAVKSDLAKLSNFELIRIYGTDCNQVPNVLSALAPHQKIFAGVFDVNDVDNSLKAIADAVQAHGGWDVIHTVSIGNELVNNGAMSASAMNQITNSSRQKLRSYGYQGPVVSVDTFIAVINNPELCDASDYMAVNAHAFFDGHIKAEDAGDWALLQIQRVWSACGGKKDVLITESGWPSSGGTNGVAVPSKQNQLAAVQSLKNVIGKDCVLFTAFNDYWKHPGAFSAEQYWGIYSE